MDEAERNALCHGEEALPTDLVLALNADALEDFVIVYNEAYYKINVKKAIELGLLTKQE